MANRYGLQIRAAGSADATGLSELMRAGGGAIPASTLAARLDALDPAGGAALIAVEWGPPSGLIVLHWCRTLHDDLPLAAVSLLFVGPDDRRRGIGRLLLKAASQAARVAGCGTMSFTAPAGEASLRAFCVATGFTEAGSTYERPLRKRS